MRRQIIINLDSDTDASAGDVSWIVQEPGKPGGPVFHGDLQTAANHAMGCRVVVLLPPESVLLTQAALPSMNRQRLVKAIPFALEENLAGDVDELHFAAGGRSDEQHVACAVVESGQMDASLSELKNVNIQPDVITSAIYATPLEDSEWTLLIDDLARPGATVLRNGVYSGLVIDHQNVVPLLHSFLENTEEEQRPERLRIITCGKTERKSLSPTEPFISDGLVPVQPVSNESLAESSDESLKQGYSDIFNQLENLCEEHDIALSIQPDDETTAVLAESFNDEGCINLLQGPYSRKEQLEKLIRPWISAAAIAFVWLLLQTGLMVTEYNSLADKDEQLRGDILSVFKDAFPDAKNIIDPKLQMQRGLDKLKGGGANNNDMISLLAMTGEIINDTDGMTVRGIRYKSDTLNLDIEISDLQALDKLKLRLINEAGLEVEIVSASSRSGKVESRLKINAA